MSSNVTGGQENKEKTRNYLDIICNYEKLLQSTQDELNFYKEEQLKLKNEVLKIIQENRTLNQQLQQIYLRNEEEGHKTIRCSAIENLKVQIRHLTEERDTVYTLWKTSQSTINNLEKELNSYRNQLSKANPTEELQKKYNDAIQLLENTVKTLRRELMKQSNINKEICKSKQQIEEKLKETEIQFKNTSTEKEKISEICNKLQSSNSNLNKELNFAMRTNYDLENSLKTAKKVIEERIIREKEALEKVQEALIVAETAIIEKEKAITREKVIRDECDQLAETIGQVMEEAAKKVEKNVETIKIEYEERIKNLENSNKETKDLLDKQIKLTHLAEMRAQTVENKLKDLIQENVTLDADLQVASQAIVEMELKLEALELLLNHNRKSHRNENDKESELQEILLNCKKFKERWKLAIEEITKKFQQEILQIQSENTSLKLENQELRLKILKQ